MLTTFPLTIETIQQIIIRIWRRSLVGKKLKTSKFLKKKNSKELQLFLKKLSKLFILRCWKVSITSKTNAVTYYQNLEEIHWLLRLEKPKKWQKNFKKKFKKNCN